MNLLSFYYKKMETTEWLANWYTSNCNGDWEHEYGIKIDTNYYNEEDWELKNKFDIQLRSLM